MVTRHSNYFFRLWSDLSDPRATLDVLISFLILLIFLEKKEANSLHLLSESISAWGVCQSFSSIKMCACVV